MLNILLSSFQAKDFEQSTYGFLLSFFKKVVYEKCFFSIAINYHASISNYCFVCFQINWRSILTSLLSSFQHQHVLYGRIPMRYQHGLSRNTMYHYITPHWILVSSYASRKTPGSPTRAQATGGRQYLNEPYNALNDPHLTRYYTRRFESSASQTKLFKVNAM